MFGSLVSLLTNSCNSERFYNHWPDTKDFREIKTLPKGPSGHPLSDNEDSTISQPCAILLAVVAPQSVPQSLSILGVI